MCERVDCVTVLLETGCLVISHILRFTCLVGSHVALAASCALFIASVKLARAGEAHGR